MLVLISTLLLLYYYGALVVTLTYGLLFLLYTLVGLSLYGIYPWVFWLEALWYN